MGYLDRLVKLVMTAQNKGIAIWVAYADDQSIDASTASSVLATQIVQSNKAASNLASLAFAAKQTAAVRHLSVVPPIVLPDESERLHKATTTVLQTASDSEDPRAIVARLVRSESLQAAADAFNAEIGASLYAKGYRRLLNPGACERCVRWAKGGKTFKAGTNFPMHPGCSCTPDPVFSTRDPSLPQYTI